MSTINFMVAFEKYYSDDVKREVTLLWIVQRLASFL